MPAIGNNPYLCRPKKLDEFTLDLPAFAEY